MFGFLKKSPAVEQPSEQQQDHLAELSREKITQLEQQLAINPRDGETQKQLMLEYNRALSLFAKSRRYRNEIDVLFVKIDELRNVVRQSI
ncbi:hypothetical protein [Pantoea agglomerans]|uniref:hypothetical protein n=1 Tax=Enterobacter agglomerans TaxID=549 RepID=UPI0013B5E67E|nr:hypothetical protein [Pantoea agglomerans]NEG57145.1 hypothetical protein [Pantoea agglomerans]NEG97831.1 hypothetical protein [Pantoea agglomerans]NEH03299.1 hypothetical protein [Pantoea agglomerans]NEH13470.1 hypothetical protein [Pantoea agglomerans]